MSLIIVAARTRPDPSQSGERVASLDDGWLQWLATANVRDGDLSVDYVGNPQDAEAAVERAIAKERYDVAVIPVGGPNGEGVTGFRPEDLATLQDLVGGLAARRPNANIVLVGAPPDEPPTFARILAHLHPPDSDDPELLAQAIQRAFDGDADRFGKFVTTLQQGVPAGTQLALRGSLIQGYSYDTQEPFDSRGPGTSDLDVVLFGEAAMAAWDADAFFMPGVNTLPLSDASAWVAPSLEPARRAAQIIARRPVSIQAMAKWFLDLRSGLQGTPYVLVDA
jgi:hypothetical protein